MVQILKQFKQEKTFEQIQKIKFSVELIWSILIPQRIFEFWIQYEIKIKTGGKKSHDTVNVCNYVGMQMVI